MQNFFADNNKGMEIWVQKCSCSCFILNSKSSSFRNTIRVSNSLEQDQSDLGPNSLKRLLADDTSRQRDYVGVVF